MTQTSANLRRLAAALAVLCVGSAAVLPARGQLIKSSLPQTEGVGVEDMRGNPLPLGLEFTDAAGKRVTARELFDGRRPVMLVMAYYTCPLLCPLVLNKVRDSLNHIDWTMGEEFRVVTVSFDHRNTPEQARVQQDAYLLGYDRPGSADGGKLRPDAWKFLCADVQNAQGIARAVGYHYRFLPENGQFSHPSAVFFLTPTGTVNGFIENIEFKPQDVQKALKEASQGKAGSLFDRVMLTCFMYDPEKGTYVLAAQKVMKLGGAVTALSLMTFVGVMFAKGHKRAALAQGSGRDS